MRFLFLLCAFLIAAAGDVTVLERTFSISVIQSGEPFPVATYHGAVTGTDAAPEDRERYVPLLVSEFSLYPSELVRRTGLRRLVLCTGLSFAGQRRNAVPDFEHHTLYLEVARGAYSTFYMRTVIHHEYFHMVDYLDDGHLYDDTAWERLNRAGFRYGAGGKHAQDDNTVSLLIETPGFLTRYAMAGVEEDKAELFAHLMVHPAAVEERARRDTVVAAKVRQMKALLARFCSRVDAAFWKRVQSRN